MEEVTSVLDFKQQMWKEGGAIPRKENGRGVWKSLVHLGEEKVPPSWSIIWKTRFRDVKFGSGHVDAEGPVGHSQGGV